MSQEHDARLLHAVREIKEIPKEASTEIIRLWQAVENHREAFIEYVKIIRVSLGIPADNKPGQIWDLSQNAQYFLLMSDRAPIPAPLSGAVTSSTEPAELLSENVYEPTAESAAQEESVAIS